MIVVVTGGRDFKDQAMVEGELAKLYFATRGPFEVWHGGCRTGADYFASLSARAHQEPHGWREKAFVADWDADGRAAGPIRNGRMVREAAFYSDSVCLAFWDGKSRGTADCMRQARHAGLIVIDVMKSKREGLKNEA